MHGLGGDMGRMNLGARHPSGRKFTQEELDEMNRSFPQPELTWYQYQVKQQLNPNDLTGSYYKTLSHLD